MKTEYILFRSFSFKTFYSRWPHQPMVAAFHGAVEKNLITMLLEKNKKYFYNAKLE